MFRISLVTLLLSTSLVVAAELPTLTQGEEHLMLLNTYVLDQTVPRVEREVLAAMNCDTSISEGAHWLKVADHRVAKLDWPSFSSEEQAAILQTTPEQALAGINAFRETGEETPYVSAIYAHVGDFIRNANSVTRSILAECRPNS